MLLLFASLCLAQEATVEVGEIVVAADAAETVTEATAALASGKFAAAADLYGALATAGGGAQARVGEAIALYELGDLRAARKAIDAALTLAPGEAGVLNVLGLIQVDSGALSEGIITLEGARKAAASQGRKASEARATINLALARVDQGDAAKADIEAEAALTLATALGDPELARAATGAKSALAGLSGGDKSVGVLLGTGQTGAARKSAEASLASAITKRQKLGATLDLAAVDRAEGRMDDASRKLVDAASQAREAGLVREQALALVDLGLVQGLVGKTGPAADTLRSAAKLAKAAGYRVVEVDARCELGFNLVRMSDLSSAEAEQRAAGTLLAGMEYPLGSARHAELGGLIAGRKGDVATAKSALGRATEFYQGKGRYLDAARAATELTGVLQATDEAAATTAAKNAESLFSKAGDSLGPAHVALARALAEGRAKRLEAALLGFARAAELAEAVGGGRGTSLARVAREDAAATLVMLGHDADLAALASKSGLGDLVKRQSAMSAAGGQYDAALAAYNTGKFDEAQTTFTDARTAFEALGEAEYALRARRSAAWSAYNGLVSKSAAAAAPGWKALVEETAKVEDAELYARAYGAAVAADHQVGGKDLSARANECIRVAGKANIGDVAARCHGVLAELDGDLKVRADHAREAFRLDVYGSSGVYALYSVAVDAYNAGDASLATELATLAKPRAGSLAPVIDEVLVAARGG